MYNAYIQELEEPKRRRAGETVPLPLLEINPSEVDSMEVDSMEVGADHTN